MNTIKTTKLATAAPIPIQAAPMRVRGTGRVIGVDSPSTGDCVKGDDVDDGNDGLDLSRSRYLCQVSPRYGPLRRR